jgi:hypothetical protein
MSEEVKIHCDGKEFATPLEASLHLLWLLQRLSYCEPHRNGMPCDGFRFREGIIEARKVLETLGYEPGKFTEPQPQQRKET